MYSTLYQPSSSESISIFSPLSIIATTSEVVLAFFLILVVSFIPVPIVAYAFVPTNNNPKHTAINVTTTFNFLLINFWKIYLIS